MKKERKTELIHFRATKTEVATIKTAAKERGMTLSKLLRLAVSEFLNREVEHNHKKSETDKTVN